MEKLIPKFIWNCKMSPLLITKTIFKKNKIGGIVLPNFKT